MFDIIIMCIIGLSMIIGLFRGLVKEATSLFIWCAAVFFSVKYYNYFNKYITFVEDDAIKTSISAFTVFIIIIIIGAIISNIINVIMKKSGLSGIDRFLGVFFGIARGVLIVSIILFVLDLFTPIAKMNEWNNSILIPYFSPIVKYLIHYAQASSSFINEHINL